MKSAVLAFSGGLDSTTLLYTMLKSFDKITTVFFNYGSRHNLQERAAAQEVLGLWPGIEFMEVTLPFHMFDGSESALLTSREMPYSTYEELLAHEGPSPTVVPFRNAVIISMCTAIAASKNAGVVAIATHATDAHNWAYPDCSPEFTGAMSSAVYVGTYNKVRLMAPFMWSTKKDIVQIAANLNVPVELTRSCYSDSEVACGRCPTCVERLEAFRAAGYEDPIPYQEQTYWYGCEEWPTVRRGTNVRTNE